MIVRDWLPARFRGAKELRSYRVATVIYGLVAGLIAWQAKISSVLDLLLVGFAMVVPPAVALGYVLYWPKAFLVGGLVARLRNYQTRGSDLRLIVRRFAGFFTGPS